MYEPTWSQPLENYQQQGSFIEPATPPATAPDAGTLVQLPCISEDWLQVVLGALDQLRNPSTWLDSLTDAQRYDVLGMADRLRQMVAMAINVPCCNVALRLNNCVLQFSVDGGATWTDATNWAADFAGCVQDAIIPTPPLLPPGSDNATRACNIASYLANDVIHVAITQAINGYDNNLSLLALAGNIAALTFAFDLPWTAAFIYGIYDLYQFFTAGNIADLRTAEADATLWSDVTCAIYNAIKTDGLITDGNCAAVIANICALTYTPSIAVTAICSYVTQLGCNGLKAAQVPGALNTADCSACGGSSHCAEWKWYNAPTDWTQLYGAYATGVGFEALNATSPTSNFCQLKATFLAPISLTGVIIGVTSSGAWSGPGFASDRSITLYLSGSIVRQVLIPLGAIGTLTKLVFTIPPTTCDEIFVDWIEDFSGVGAKLKYFEVLTELPWPYTPLPCTD